MPPNCSFAAAYIACTDDSSATSTCTASPPGTCAATASAASRFTSATQTRAPSSVKSNAASAPMPPPAPVITHTLSVEPPWHQSSVA